MSNMKKEYITPFTKAIELQHMTRLLAGSGDVRVFESNGWNNIEDELDLSKLGGGNSIWDR